MELWGLGFFRTDEARVEVAESFSLRFAAFSEDVIRLLYIVWELTL
jgi:hypothetical protein